MLATHVSDIVIAIAIAVCERTIKEDYGAINVLFEGYCCLQGQLCDHRLWI